MDKDNISFLLKDALDEYQSDPRGDWFGYMGEECSNEREKNYLMLLLSDIRDAAHDSLFASHYLKESTGIERDNIPSLIEAKNKINIVISSPFFHRSLLSPHSIDAFILSMSEVEKICRLLRKRMAIVLSSYKKGVLTLSQSLLMAAEENKYSGKEYREIKRVLKRERKGDNKIPYEEICLVSRRILYLIRENKRLKSLLSSIEFPSPLYKGIDTDWEEYKERLSEYRCAIRSLGGIVNKEISPQELSKVIKRVEDIERRYGDSLSRVDQLFSPSILSLPFSLLEEKTEASLSSFHKLPIWLKYRELFILAEKDGSLDSFFSPPPIVEVEEEAIKEIEEKEKEDKLVFPPYPEYEWKGEGESLLHSLLSSLCPIRERDALRLLSLYGGEEEKRKALEEKGSLYEERNGFWYQKGAPIFFRESEKRRDFSHIAPEELLDGLLSILSFYGKMKKEDLYGILGEKCGMKIVLSVRYRELDKVLFSSERIKVEGEYIFLEDGEV